MSHRPLINVIITRRLTPTFPCHQRSFSNDGAAIAALTLYREWSRISTRRKQRQKHRRWRTQSPSATATVIEGIQNNQESSGLQQQQEQEEEEYDVDSATIKSHREPRNVSSILGGVPLSDHHPSEFKKENNKPNAKKSFRDWISILQQTWTCYKLTWEGFLSSQQQNNHIHDTQQQQDPAQDDEQKQQLRNELQQQVIETTQQIQSNLKTNIQTLQQTSQEVLQYAKDTTQIHNKTDFKRWIMMQMQLLTDMVREFMNGYRQARQEEMERTITLYFKDLDNDENQKKNDTSPIKHEDDTYTHTRIPKRKTTRRLYQFIEEVKKGKQS